MDFLLNLSGPILYIIIFIAKIIEVSMMTLRLVYINKGEKLIGAIIGFFEVMIWLIIVSSVLTNVTEDPIKVFVYCFAYSIGSFVGVTIENKIAVGLASLQVVIGEDEGDDLASLMRQDGFGVTILDGRGIDKSKKSVLFIQLKRKRIPEAIKLIQNTYSDAFISVNDLKSVKGGFLIK